MPSHTELSVHRPEYQIFTFIGMADVGSTEMNPAISEAIKSTVDASVGRLTDRPTEVIEARLLSFAQRFSQKNGATVEASRQKGPP